MGTLPQQRVLMANGDGARKMVLALSTLSRDTPTRGCTSILNLMGTLSLAEGRRMRHKHAMKHLKSIVNVMKVNISITWWINKIMYTWLLIA